MVEGSSPHCKLLERIKIANDKGVEPPSMPTVVHFGASLVNLIDFDEKNGIATLNLWEKLVSGPYTVMH